MQPVRRTFQRKPAAPFTRPHVFQRGASEGQGAAPVGHDRRGAAKTSWEPVASWYKGYLNKDDTFQDKIIFPGALRLLAPKAEGRYLDIACGEGTFTRLLAQGRELHVVGIDAAPSLIEAAQRRAPKRADYEKLDAARIGERFEAKSFDGATCILAIQNIEAADDVIRGAARILKPGAPLVIVMNHPAFRQPRQSGWGWDEARKLQYRRVDKYLSLYSAPIQAHPGADAKTVTWSYHRPLQAYFAALTQAGFMIDGLEEWASHRTSDSGPKARAENSAREEIPMFLALRAIKMK
jgi:ubiquinone/menaquinone biosynthesis C-methylase UbiE